MVPRRRTSRHDAPPLATRTVHKAPHCVRQGWVYRPRFLNLDFATVGQIFLITAFLYTPASTLAPFQYTQLVAATLFGMIVFDSLPDPVTWAGIGLVVGAGLYIAFREARLSELV